eukprot:8139-Heterococcus_DN1.PRE.5
MMPVLIMIGLLHPSVSQDKSIQCKRTHAYTTRLIVANKFHPMFAVRDERHTVSKCNFKRSDISDLTCIQRSASGVPLACHAYLNIKQAGTHCRAGDQDAHLLFAARHS